MDLDLKKKNYVTRIKQLYGTNKSNYINNYYMENKGFIYKIISPSNKAYIGQVTEYLRNGKKKGIRGRWLQHCCSAKTNKGCIYLNNAIRKYP